MSSLVSNTSHFHNLTLAVHINLKHVVINSILQNLLRICASACKANQSKILKFSLAFRNIFVTIQVESKVQFQSPFPIFHTFPLPSKVSMLIWCVVNACLSSILILFGADWQIFFVALYKWVYWCKCWIRLNYLLPAHTLYTTNCSPVSAQPLDCRNRITQSFLLLKLYIYVFRMQCQSSAK